MMDHDVNKFERKAKRDRISLVVRTGWFEIAWFSTNRLVELP